MNIATLNCQGLKSNFQMCSNIINSSDATFICEHWLTNDESNIIENISSNNTIYNFHSDMPVSSCALSRRGRPFSGRGWIISNRFKVVSYDLIEDLISVMEVEVCLDGVRSNMLLIGVWIAFDDGTAEKFALTKATISAI